MVVDNTTARPTVRYMAPQLGTEQSDLSDARLAAMVAESDLPSLLATLAHVCSAPDLPGTGLALDRTKHHEPQGG